MVVVQKKKDIFVAENASKPFCRVLCAFFVGNGELLEWLKRHAWKACIRQKRIGGSNPPLSANY